MSRRLFPVVRNHRLRKTAALRSLVAENNVTSNDLIYPIFVEEDASDMVEIKSMPGFYRIPESMLRDEITAIYDDGVKAIMMFGVSCHKNDDGRDSWFEDGLLSRMIRTAKQAAPKLIVISDICLCEYTIHGHCGVLENGRINNDRTIEILGLQAVVAAMSR